MPVLDEFKRRQNLTDVDFVNWRNEEYNYLGKVAAEPSVDAIAVAYVEQLEKLQFAEFVVLMYYSTIFSLRVLEQCMAVSPLYPF
jgi:hypothetical protein